MHFFFGWEPKYGDSFKPFCIFGVEFTLKSRKFPNFSKFFVAKYFYFTDWTTLLPDFGFELFPKFSTGELRLSCSGETLFSPLLFCFLFPLATLCATFSLRGESGLASLCQSALL
jgi:hypothetical protein